MGIKSTTKYLYSLVPYADITSRQESASVQGDKDRMPRSQRKLDLVEVKYTEANKDDFTAYEQSETPLRLNSLSFDNTYNSISLKSSDITITNDLGLEIGYIDITAAGSSYTAGTLTASGGGGFGFKGTYTVNSGAIDSVTILNRGQGYTSVPTIVITEGSGSSGSSGSLTPHLLQPLESEDLANNNKENPCYTLALATSYLPLAGGTMTGSVDFGDNDITNVDSLDADKLSIAGGTEMTGFIDADDMSTGASATTISSSESIKAYVDAVPLGAFNPIAIKVMPTQFRVNDDYARVPNIVEDDTADTLGIRMASSAEEAFAFVKIPNGYTATHVRVNASASTASALEVYQFNYTTGAIVAKGSGDFNASLDITDVDSGAAVDLVIKIIPASTSTIIYGALVTIAAT